jgi:hypothetical protein
MLVDLRIHVEELGTVSLLTRIQAMNLNRVAQQMRIQIAALPYGLLQSALAGDLTVALQRNQDHYRLALGRDGLAPAPSDVLRLASAFAVPEGTEPVLRKRQERHPCSGRLINWYVVELQWIEFGR